MIDDTILTLNAFINVIIILYCKPNNITIKQSKYTQWGKINCAVGKATGQITCACATIHICESICKSRSMVVREGPRPVVQARGADAGRAVCAGARAGKAARVVNLPHGHGS